MSRLSKRITLQTPQITLTAIGMTCALAFSADADFAQAAAKAERMLRNVERSLCRNLKLSGCRKQARKWKTPVSQRSAVKKQRPSKPRTQTAQKVPKPPKKVDEAGKTNPFEPPLRDKPRAESDGGAEITNTRPPRPREKPAVFDKTVIETPTAKPKATTTPANQPPAPTTASSTLMETAVGSFCRMKLASLGAAFDAVTDDVGSGQCRVAHPVKLSSLKIGTARIEFPDSPMLNCTFAVKFMEWLEDTGAPIVRAQANSPITRLWTGPGYECRGRNGDSSAKISEHGFGNAVDITNFKLEDGRMFEVKDALNPLSPAYATLKGLRGSACGYFTTVLGPGANAAHETHFHFDMGKHGRSDSYKICQ